MCIQIDRMLYRLCFRTDNSAFELQSFHSALPIDLHLQGILQETSQEPNQPTWLHLDSFHRQMRHLQCNLHHRHCQTLPIEHCRLLLPALGGVPLHHCQLLGVRP